MKKIQSVISTAKMASNWLTDLNSGVVVKCVHFTDATGMNCCSFSAIDTLL